MGGLNIPKCLLILLLIPLALSGCGPKVMVPPLVDLAPYDIVGIIEFSCNYEGNLAPFATQKFMEQIQYAQPGVRILEIGSEKRALEAVGHSQLNYEAVQAIGEEYSVDALIIGAMDIDDIKPSVDLSTILTSAEVRADVKASLTARLHETHSGATIWTNSAQRTETVAHVSILSGGAVSFDASDPDNAYGRLVYNLVEVVTDDFRVHYRRQ
jgi:hypothetical protein